MKFHININFETNTDTETSSDYQYNTKVEFSDDASEIVCEVLELLALRLEKIKQELKQEN